MVELKKMYFYSVFLLVIFSTFSTAHTQTKKECIELITNNTTNTSNQNQTALQSNEDANNQTSTSKTNFLPNDTILSVLNIPVANSGNAMDILKKSRSSMAATSKFTTEDKEENLTTANNTMRITNVSPHDTAFLNFNTNNEKAIELLKDATDNTNLTNRDQIDDITDEEESGTKYNKGFTASINTTQNLNKSIQVSTKTNTSTGGSTSSDEIALSELTNLSYADGEELNVGQKIEFQRSNVDSETKNINSAGTDILTNTSKICGSLLGKRISFANETTLMEYPWTALLLYNTKIRYHCGGSLITENYILTAAHCVAQEFYELIGVRLGEHDITTEVDCAEDIGGDQICAKTVDAEVTKIIIHHAYSHLSFKHDIALLKLDKSYWSRSFYPICLPTPDMMDSSKNAIVAGWGATEKAIRSAVLLKADVPIFDISKCREIYRYSVFNDSTEICGSGANEVDVCKGDSGGALFNYHTVGRRGKYYQFGIISLGVRRCGDSRFLPAVFTKLSGFYKWIENNLEY